MSNYIIFNGRNHTLKYSGGHYELESFSTLEERIKAPGCVEKSFATAAIFSNINSSFARSADEQRRIGQFCALPMDIDSGNPSLEQINAAVTNIFGNYRRYIYSSASASESNRKWRVILPTLNPFPGAYYTEYQLALIRLMDKEGIQLDPALKTPSQPIFLPNIPPEYRLETGQPIFYQWSISDENICPDITSIDMLVKCVEALRLEEAKRISDLERARALKAAERRSMAEAGVINPIEHFNAHHSLEALMLRYGWLHKHRNWYASPFSKSKGASVCVLGERAVSFTASDEERVGRSAEGKRTTYDAFDVFCAFEHDNDSRKAVRRYAQEAGLNRGNDISIFLKRWGLNDE